MVIEVNVLVLSLTEGQQLTWLEIFKYVDIVRNDRWLKCELKKIIFHHEVLFNLCFDARKIKKLDESGLLTLIIIWANCQEIKKSKL